MAIVHVLNPARIPVLAVFGIGSVLACATPAFAQEFRPHVEVMPFAGYRMGGKFEYESVNTSRTLDIRDDSSWGVDVGIYRDNQSFYEGLYSQQNAQLDTRATTLGNLQLRTEYIHLGGTLLFPQESWLVSYLSMTVGMTKFDPQGSGYISQSDFSVSLGGGLRFPLNEHFAMQLGLRGYLTFVDTSTRIFCAGSGDVACLFRISGNSFFQGEGQLGFVVTF